MIQSIHAIQSVTKEHTKQAPARQRSYATPSNYFGLSIDEDDDDFMSPSLDEINFEELAVEESKDFRYDDDYEEDMEEDDED